MSNFFIRRKTKIPKDVVTYVFLRARGQSCSPDEVRAELTYLERRLIFPHSGSTVRLLEEKSFYWSHWFHWSRCPDVSASPLVLLALSLLDSTLLLLRR